ncbi:F-box/FBD/LRR-repeat protein At1g13570-like [Lycium ferocissimum]|uniref:F-box/FBD/LRR-repeat protein At1g13570-like n=1 Tax=Lycium ferocissimum TaxID=112874 RepID=UPI00281632A0|nr:F-box/FBD/LRR-repeat protein At1g13570-like [Lycium ferocissimum]
MRSGKRPAADRISSLPCDVLEKILGCLPLHYAVRTSVLSREWRYKWAVRSELMFDDNVDKGLFLKTIIYQVLLLHQGPLRKFSLPVPKYVLFPDIDNWIMFLSKKNVQEFSLRFCYSEDFLLPSHLFKFHDLRHLELLSCKFRPAPNFKAFSRLVTLDFRFVTFEPTSFQTLLSSSPLLERVKLKWCTQFDNFIVDAPHLKFFEFYGTARSYCFKNAPLLEEIIMARACHEISKVIIIIEKFDRRITGFAP